jgi:hypothetical protein
MHERTSIRLSAADRSELETVAANRNSPQKHVWRAKIVLLTAGGLGTADIMCLSEVWLKLLGTVSLDDTGEFTPAAAPEWTVDPQTPERDGRVVWLIEEIGGAEAIAHRHEDIRRQRFGRAKPGGGRPIVQLEDETVDLGLDPDQPVGLQRIDAYRVWCGLCNGRSGVSTTR